MATKDKSPSPTGLLDELPIDRLKEEVVELGKAMARRGVARIGERVSGATDKLGDVGDAVPGPGDLAKAALKAGSPIGGVTDGVKGAASKVKDALPGVGDDGDDGDGDGGGKAPAGDNTNLKVTNIVESIDVPVSRDVAYELWTQFEDFPSFMKKVENVKQKDPDELTWKAQIFWSHRTWTAKIVEQVPPERIVWKSEAEKGKVDGAVTFHELAPDLTRVLVSLEYFPQGLFERTGNIWRAQGRRVRLELRHFRRHVANHALMHQDEVDGWTGEIREGKVKRQRGSSSGSGTAKRGSASKSTGSKSSRSKSSDSTSSSTAKKAPAKKAAAKKAPAKKTAARKTAATSSASSSPRKTASKSTGGGSTARKSTPRKSTAKKTASKSTASRSTARKSAPRKTAAARKSSSTRTARAKS